MIPIPSSRRVLAEIALIFAIFFIQGAWPVPDVNEPHYLGKTIHYWNPAWVSGDFFLDSKDTHKVFYLTFGWLSLWLAPTALTWTGRLITWWLLAWSWRRLSFAVLPRAGWSILTAALFAMLMDRCNMAGEWVVGGVEAKGFAYVLLFLGLEALVRNRWNRVWLLLGAASAFHVLVGGWATVAAGLAWLFIGRHRPRLRTMWPALLAGFLLALPGVMPAILLNAHTDAAIVRQANQIYVFERLPHHLNLFQMAPDFILRFASLLMFFVVVSWRIFFVGKGDANAGSGFSTDDGSLESARKRLAAFVIGAIAIALVGAIINVTVFIDRELAAGWLRFYWYRLADVAVPLGVAILGSWWIKESWHYRTVMCGCITLLVGLATIYHFGALAVQRVRPAAPRAERMHDAPAWQEACLWAADRRNTPPNARFITPRMAQTFKWYARRAEVATWKDVPQDAPEIVQWWTRIQDLFAADLSDPEYHWHESLTELGAERIEQLGKKYQADFLITESANPPLNSKVVYRNESFVIYRLGYRLETVGRNLEGE